ncbi:MAG: phosphate acyltransferase PlsX [Anaerolineae bacterium]|nr:phosphate acyltransferase PlsX [Anaerolineae bacterium]
MRIVLDAMGTDARPVPDVAGGLQAAREYDVTVIFVGPRDNIERELDKNDTRNCRLEIVDAPEVIEMKDKPSAILKDKPRSSMHVGLQMVRDGLAEAFVTMGNTGAALAVATLASLGRIPGIKRPALSAMYAVNGRKMIFLDMGATPDAKAEWLEQFALMGSIYAQTALSITQPRIATLCNGEEEGKGNLLTRETYDRLSVSNLNYVGHIEPIEILQGKADVVVVDGFVGNIFLKTFEGTIRYVTNVIREEIMAKPLYKLGAMLARGAFRGVRNRLDTSEIGGAPLLGVNGVVIVGHGSADARSVRSAIRQAQLAVLGRTVSAIRNGIAMYQQAE